MLNDLSVPKGAQLAYVQFLGVSRFSCFWLSRQLKSHPYLPESSAECSVLMVNMTTEYSGVLQMRGLNITPEYVLNNTGVFSQ